MAVFDEYHRSQCDEVLKALQNEWVPLRQGRKHERGALRVPDVAQVALSGCLLDILEGRREVMLGHLLPREVPELLLLVGEAAVGEAVLVATAVGEPDVKVPVREKEGAAEVFVVDDPGVRGVKQPVLHKDNWLPRSELHVLSRDPEVLEDVPVLGRDVVHLHQVLVVETQLLEGHRG